MADKLNTEKPPHHCPVSYGRATGTCTYPKCQCVWELGITNPLIKKEHENNIYYENIELSERNV